MVEYTLQCEAEMDACPGHTTVTVSIGDPEPAECNTCGGPARVVSTQVLD